MIRIALVHNHYDNKHLDMVKKEMLTLGSPVIQAVWMECYGHWAALEGCHRVRAAAALGLPIEIEEVEYSDDEWLDGTLISELCDASNKSTIIEAEES